ncbi:hypothetical protein DsansV1_C23g0176171 [Dioscorea sansibarensis]
MKSSSPASCTTVWIAGIFIRVDIVLVMERRNHGLCPLRRNRQNLQLHNDLLHFVYFMKCMSTLPGF